jgi:hypothetical protein
MMKRSPKAESSPAAQWRKGAVNRNRCKFGAEGNTAMIWRKSSGERVSSGRLNA